jgi:hypothetical protein
VPGKERQEMRRKKSKKNETKVGLRIFTYHYVFFLYFWGAQREKGWCCFSGSGSPSSGALIIGQQHLVQTKALKIILTNFEP